MAMTINSSPVLQGESAMAFWEEAEQNSKLPTPSLTSAQEIMLHEIEQKSRELYLRLFRKNNG